MPEISVLSESLTNKIAAGEVIERPASVVRELVDNSIDAGARTVTIEVFHGGKKLIGVYDDGIGMDREDASLSFERHATSKIKSEDELFNITTLGFRGEALPSIASISKVTLITSPVNSRIGTKVEIGVGNKKEVAEAPPLRGTAIEVRDIFYNTPARRKFLKSIPTELSHIIGIITQKALSYPGISFLFKHNDSEVVNVSAAKDIKERFIQLYGEDFINSFLELGKETSKGVELCGFSSIAEFARASRGYQFIFINRRPVKNPTISHAVYNAYKELMPKDRHPAFFLFLEIDPEKVDVNVHPAKREVRFESPDEIHRLVESTIRKALNPRREEAAEYTASPVSGFKGEQSNRDKIQGWTVCETIESALQSQGESLSLKGDFQTDFFAGGIIPDVHRFFYIGESFVAEATKDGLVIIDQHAVHERVLYEKLLKKTTLDIENLFLPVRVELPVKEFKIIMNYKGLFNDFGLDIAEFGTNNVIIRALPREFHGSDMKGLLLDIASGILEQETIGTKDETGKQNLLRNIAAMLACHKSVRGKKHLNDEELSQLAADLEKTEVPDKCPHGRPTRIYFSMDDLRKMFKRK